jgi:hypothetical protein
MGTPWAPFVLAGAVDEFLPLLQAAPSLQHPATGLSSSPTRVCLEMSADPNPLAHPSQEAGAEEGGQPPTPPCTNSLLRQLHAERQTRRGSQRVSMPQSRMPTLTAQGGRSTSQPPGGPGCSITLLDLFSGVSTAVCGALRAGFRVHR